jgi:hypothetical protein
MFARGLVLLVAVSVAVTSGVLCGFTVDAAARSLSGDPLVQTARLTASDGSVFSSAGFSGGVLVAGAPGATVGGNQRQGAVNVYVQPAGGWRDASEGARLTASDGQAGDGLGTSLAISGDTVVAGDVGEPTSAEPDRGKVLYVFTKPAGGWSGTVHESARLTITDPAAAPAQFTTVAISGHTIVAGTAGSPAADAYVFSEPASGWSGTIHESAKLTASDASRSCFTGLGAVAIDGQTVVAGTPGSDCSPGTAYVFSEPAAGWSGTLQENARLVEPSTQRLSSVAVLGSNVVAAGIGAAPTFGAVDPAVFRRPPSGWSGTIYPAAKLAITIGGSTAAPTELVAGAGDAIAVLGVTNHDTGCPFEACDASLYGYVQPPGGWSGTITGPRATVTVGPPGGYPLAIEGRTIASGGDQPTNALDIFTITAGLPSARNASLSGLARGRPKLRFTLDAGQSAAPIRSFKLSLPRGLRFARGRGGHIRGVLIKGTSPRAVRLSHGALTVTLARPAESLSVAIAPAALIEQASLISEARRIQIYNRTHQRKRVLTVNIRAVLTDASSHTSRLTLKVSGS